ncbi:MAG: lytic murein transglycosylase B [Burkholderiales bacterium]|nr:lytic murein transglycosylase B [Burkholderiales bacterium]
MFGTTCFAIFGRPQPLWRTAQTALLAAMLAAAGTSAAQDFRDRPELAALKAELIAESGYDAAALDDVFSRVKRLERVIGYMDAPIRTPAPWHVYWPRHIGGDRLQRGGDFMRTNRAAFENAERAWGVPAPVIAAIIGVETVYGRLTGNFRAIDALATLAFDYPRRADFFRNELKELLLLAREQKRSPLEFMGSFAGAMGWPQFMPGSYRKWAVDFDNDQKIDLWNSPADIIGSVASFLAGHGWQRGEPVMLPIAKPSPEIIATFDGGLAPRKALKDYVAAGVTITARDRDVTLPNDDAQVGLISLDRADGSDEYWLVFENFYVITRYNRSRMYASSVWSLAYALNGALKR